VPGGDAVVALEAGSLAGFIADWPESDLVGLFELLKKRGSRLDGMSGQRFQHDVENLSLFKG